AGVGGLASKRRWSSSTRVRSCVNKSPQPRSLAASVGEAIDWVMRCPFLVGVLVTPYARKGASLWQGHQAKFSLAHGPKAAFSSETFDARATAPGTGVSLRPVLREVEVGVIAGVERHLALLLHQLAVGSPPADVDVVGVLASRGQIGRGVLAYAAGLGGLRVVEPHLGVLRHRQGDVELGIG